MTGWFEPPTLTINPVRTLLLLGLVALGIFLAVIFSSSPPPAVAFVSATQLFSELIASPLVPADRLAELFPKVPTASLPPLRRKPLLLVGTIAAMRLRGIEQNILSLELATTAPKPICIDLDLKKYNTLKSYSDPGLRYEIIGPEALLFSRSAQEGRVIFRVGQEIKQRARFSDIQLNDILFNAE